MAISLERARKLCTQAEFELVESSVGRNARELSPARLKQKIDRTRKLRDKYRDLSKRQRLEARGKKAPSGSRPAKGQDNTERKAQLFQEVLDRFESYTERIQAREDRREAAGAAGGSGSGASKSGASKSGASKSAASKSGASKSAAPKSGGSKSAAWKSAESKSAASKSGVSKSGASKSGESKSGESKPGAAKPAATSKGAGSKSAGSKTGGSKAAATKIAGSKSAGSKGGGSKTAGRKSAAQSGGGRAASKQAAGGATGLADEIPAGGRAGQPAAPRKPGAKAMKGARTRPMKGGPQDQQQRAASKTSQAHTRSAGQRNQAKRDKR
jgi:hypothetical protein